jgi:xanthine dehydrogenase accessory factor
MSAPEQPVCVNSEDRPLCVNSEDRPLRFCAWLQEALAAGQPFALGIIAGAKGSSPQKQGAKAIFFPDGRILGTLGGGCLEAEVQERARRALATGQPATFELVLDHDFGWDDGLICGGSVAGLILPQAAAARELWLELAALEETRTWGVKDDFTIGWVTELGGPWRYQETISPPCVLWVAGAGHVAQAVAPLALDLDFAVTVMDDRAALASRRHFPAGTRLRTGPWEQMLLDPLPRQPTFGLIVTRGHQHDALVLRHWLAKPFAYLGMIGSRRKARLLFDGLLELGAATPEALARVHSPVGLDIGAVSVQEIAVSIVAQLIQKRAECLASRKSGGPSATNH